MASRQGIGMGQGTVIICPVCKRPNPPERSRCAECWGSLAGAAPITEEEAQELAGRLRAARRRRRLALWSLAAAIVLGVGGWIAYQNLGAARLLPPPVSAIGAVPKAGDWPMYRRDTTHSGFVPDPDGVPRGELKWRFATGEPILSSPAVVDGVLYLSTGDRRIVALNADSGELIWEHGVTGPVDSSVAVAGDLVFVGLRDGRVLALDRHDGELRWAFATEGPVLSSPAVYQGVLYIGSGDFRVYALDAMTGRKRWSYDTGDWVVAGPAVYEGMVAAMSQSSILYIIDTKTGKPTLDYKVFHAVGAPVIEGDRVYLVNRDGVLSGVDRRKRDYPFEKLMRRVRIQLFVWDVVDTIGAQRGFVWSRQNPGVDYVGAPVPAWDNLYVAASNGQLFAVAASTGQKVWEFQADARLDAGVAVVHQTVFAGDAQGRLYAIDALTGEKRWELQLGGAITSAPVAANRMLFISSEDGALYAVE